MRAALILVTAVAVWAAVRSIVSSVRRVILAVLFRRFELSWATWGLPDGDRVPCGRQAIYAQWTRRRWWVAGRRRCAYVGRSNCFERRMAQHWLDGKPQAERWSRCTVWLLPPGANVEYARRQEQRAKDAYRPRFNKRDEVAR